MKSIGVLVIGAGPAGLAAAIKAKRALVDGGSDAAVVVVDKAPKAGNHSLSGGLLETACLDDLVPGWRNEKSPFTERLDPIARDDMYFLTPRLAVPVPKPVVPGPMHHRGDLPVSVSQLAAFLAKQAEKIGVELYFGYSIGGLLIEDGKVVGCRISDSGLDKDGQPKVNHLASEQIRAAVTVLADGSGGVLSTEFRNLFGGGPNPQVYSVGIKTVFQFQGKSPFGVNRAVHTLGFPAPASVFGGGFVYSMGESLTAAGIILGLDWKYGDLNPYEAFEAYRAHPLVSKWLKGGTPVATGARTIPEGGYYSLSRLFGPGALVAGDAAGFVNMRKIKGMHYAILTGAAAGLTAAEAVLESDTTEARLSDYENKVESLGVLADMKKGRNYRQVFRSGLYIGAPMTFIQGLLPYRVSIEPDADGLKANKRLKLRTPAGIDQAAFIGLTGTHHREDEPSHISILDPSLCAECREKYGCACVNFCPGQVYRLSSDHIVLSPSNCLHCLTCVGKCPFRNIRWQAPEGGEGPRYKQM